MYIYVHVFGMRSNKNWFEGVQRIVLGVTCMLSALSIRVHLLKKKDIFNWGIRKNSLMKITVNETFVYR